MSGGVADVEIETHTATRRLERLTAGEPVRESLTPEGRLFVDRLLPFLCLYRRPLDLEDDAAAALVTSQAAYLIGSGGSAAQTDMARTVQAVADYATDACGRFLLIEVWERPDPDEPDPNEPVLRAPAFGVVASKDGALGETVSCLTHALEQIDVHKIAPDVRATRHEAPAPPGMTPLDPGGDTLAIGVEVTPVYRDPDTGEIYPFLFEHFRRTLGEAIQKTCHRFACDHTPLRVPHYLALGRRTLEEATVAVDHALAEIGTSFRFLLQVSPVNAQEERERLEANGYSEEPVFRYRPLTVDPELLKRRLFRLPIERVEDPALAWLFRESQEELDRKITMLRDRGTRQFFFGSLQLFGEVEPHLLALAEEILRRVPNDDYGLGSSEHLDPDAFAQLAGVEFQQYRERMADFPARLQVRRDLPPGLMVSQGQLLMGADTRIPAERVDALLQHEVGTHMVTYYNGHVQPLHLLRTGLAGYEALQEGIAVLAEYLVGGLTVPRLRVLAARVVAAQALVDDASFLDIFHLLRNTHDFEVDEAYAIAQRTVRGGGFIKDVIYLRGLSTLIDYLQGGGSLERLFVGKIAMHHLSVLEELEQREVLLPAPLTPRFMERPEAADRLEQVRNGLPIVELVKGKHA
jgi:uncharacterized protein (TIGR02421 family)